MAKSTAKKFGQFIGEVKTVWLRNPKGPDRGMLLIEDFEFVDPRKVSWKAPLGTVVDGASIPSALWGPVLGSPLTGDFRRASVIHDWACIDKPHTSKMAHRMFYDAMRCDGTSDWLAKVMFVAVTMFGPKWGPGGKAMRPLRPLTRENIDIFHALITSDLFAKASITALEARLEVNKP
jgi:hypothetical protein